MLTEVPLHLPVCPVDPAKFRRLWDTEKPGPESWIKYKFSDSSPADRSYRWPLSLCGGGNRVPEQSKQRIALDRNSLGLIVAEFSIGGDAAGH